MVKIQKKCEDEVKFMKVLHLNAGNETGGGMVHILSLLKEFNRDEFILGVFEEGKLLEKANELGIKTVLFPQKTKCDITIVKNIVQFIREHHIDMYHTHGPRANVIGALVRLFTPCKWIVTVHSDPRQDFIAKGFIGKMLSNLNIFSFRRADHIFAISERFKKILIDLQIEERKITTIFNGIDFSKTLEPPYKREEFNLSKDAFVIVMVARLEKIKGHLIAFKAFKQVLQSCPSSHLLLIGSGSLENELKRKVVKEGLQNRVHFLGYREDVERILPIADVLLLSSFSESFPLVILEAARAKIPVITTNVGGVHHLISDKSLGWIVPIGDHEKLKRSIMEASALKKRGKLKEFGERLYLKASKNYSIQKFSESIYSTYKKILDIM
jgi:L-malate glycosyltransferase